MTSTINKLKQRGIYDSAVKLGCTIEGDKLFIPIRTLSGATIAKRVKNFGDGQKYFWSPSKPKGNAVDWFLAPNTRQAIADNDGVCYLANGEPAMLAMIAAGVTNVISTTLSEISVPKNIIDMFGATVLDIKELRYLKDKDEAGQTSAINWRDALLNSDVNFIAYDMPDYLADKADINDLWIYHGFSSGQFRDALESLYKAMLPLPEVKPVIEYDTELADTPQALIDTIISRLGIQHFNNDGWSSKKVVSPFRTDDENPSFNLNRNTGVGGDWGTNQYYSPYAIAKELNIEYSKPTPKQETHYSPDKLEAAFQEYLENMPAPIELDLYDSELLPGGRKSWINQEHLPKSWIQACLTLSDTRSAVTTLFIKLHHAFMIGSLNPNNFTLKQIRDTLYDGKRRLSTSAALQSLISLKVVRDNGAYSIYKEMPNKPLQLEIIGSPTLIGLNFLDMLDRYILEQHTSKALAPRLSTLIHDLDLSLEDAKKWHDRVSGLISSETEYKIKSDKRYWLDLLTGDSRYDVIEYDLNFDNVDIRAALLTDYLTNQSMHIKTTAKDGEEHVKIIHRQQQMSQPEIMRLCGLKSASFKPIFKLAGVTTEQRQRLHQVKKPNSCNLQYELTQSTQAKNNDGRGGHLVWLRIKPIGGKFGQKIYGVKNMITQWENLKGISEDEPRIFGITIKVQLPSLVRFKTAQELADEAKEEQRKAFEKAQAEVNNTPEYVAIVGSRNYPHLEKVREYVRTLKKNVVVVSGGAIGVDSTAENEAKKCGLEVISYLPDWNKHGNSAGFIRNETIISKSNRVVAFRSDGKSNGTDNSIKHAKKQNKQVDVFYPSDEPTQADTEETPKIADKPRRKPSYKASPDRSWNSHDKQWLHNQLAAEMYCWLNEDIDKSGLVGANNVIRYINEQIILRDIDKPYHSAETFFNDEPLEFGIDAIPEAPTEEIIEAIPEPLPTIDNPKKVTLKNPIRLNLAQTRAWAKSDDKQAYLESIET